MKAIKTKIIATIGPSTNTYDSLKKLHKAGMNVARINMSHATHTDAQNIIDLVQQINSEQSVDHGPIGLLLDTQGPEIRTGTNQSDMDLTVGDIVNLTIREDLDVETSSIQINYKGLIKSVSKGSRISLDNGLINFKVLAKDKENLTCKVLDGGKLGSKRHVNLPGVRVDLPSITKKDRKDILLAIKNNVSFIALSFVRSAQDINDLRDILNKKKSSARIIAKIENQEGLDNIHEITKATDIVMVARGDLGIETDLADLPNIQRRIMYVTAKWGKRSIVATHLLESMIVNPTPTRAEVTDVANAIYEGADAVMLSAESAAGSYPVEAVRTMNAVAVEVEKDQTYRTGIEATRSTARSKVADAITAAAREIAETTDVKAICCFTSSGTTAVLASRERPKVPIIALTSLPTVARRLGLVWGLHCVVTGEVTRFKHAVISAARAARSYEFAENNDKIVVTAGVPFNTAGSTNIIRVASVDEKIITALES